MSNFTLWLDISIFRFLVVEILTEVDTILDYFKTKFHYLVVWEKKLGGLFQYVTPLKKLGVCLTIRTTLFMRQVNIEENNVVFIMKITMTKILQINWEVCYIRYQFLQWLCWQPAWTLVKHNVLWWMHSNSYIYYGKLCFTTFLWNASISHNDLQ